jgi:hypothetical protein
MTVQERVVYSWAQCYPNYKTVHRRFQSWCRSDVLRSRRTVQTAASRPHKIDGA